MRMPRLGNHVVITGGATAEGVERSDSTEEILAMHSYPTPEMYVKATRRTDVRVEKVDSPEYQELSDIRSKPK